MEEPKFDISQIPFMLLNLNLDIAAQQQVILDRIDQIFHALTNGKLSHNELRQKLQEDFAGARKNILESMFGEYGVIPPEIMQILNQKD